MFESSRPACRRTVSMLSTAWPICAAMSPGCCGAPLASTDVCPEQTTVRFVPLSSLACTKPKASCQLHGLITRRSMAERMGDEERRRKTAPEAASRRCACVTSPGGGNRACTGTRDGASAPGTSGKSDRSPGVATGASYESTPPDDGAVLASARCRTARQRWSRRHCEHRARRRATTIGGAMDWTCALSRRSWRLATSIGPLGVLVAIPVPANACDSASCNTCRAGCTANTTACNDACLQAFLSCLNGCTTEFCAPFCQVDYGRC